MGCNSKWINSWSYSEERAFTFPLLSFTFLPSSVTAIMSAHQANSERISVEEDPRDIKNVAECLDELDEHDAAKPSGALEAPPLVRDLSPADRERLEKKLVRKIDFRLLPAVIIMYIMNYLDRVSTSMAWL